MVLTDGDIVVPSPENQVCWLGYLKQKMDGNIAVPFLILWYGLPLTRKSIGLLVTITSLGKLSRYG
jgi:hypothetical protein